jgi:F-type H+-transporting ATPase subunit a
LEKTSKWRWGVNRWWILGFTILGIVGVNLFAPVQPHIQVAAEKLMEEPLLHLGPLGDLYLTNTLTATILVDIIIIGIALAIRSATRKGSLVPGGLSGAMELAIEAVYNMTESSAGKWAKKIFPWFMTILFLVLVANLVKLLPGFETIGLVHHATKDGHALQQLSAGIATVIPAEGDYVITPFLRGVSTDLNFTAALALIAVVMTQVIGVQAQGVRYFSKFFNFTTMFKKPFFGFMDFIVGLLETISEFAKVISFTFRLFGNMFAGMVLVALIGVMVPIFVPSLVFMFEFFIGLIQAFVFGMLTMTFMAQATQGHGDHEEQSAHES